MCSLIGFGVVKEGIELSECSSSEEGENSESEEKSEKELEKEFEALLQRHLSIATLRSNSSSYVLKNNGLGNVFADVLTPPPELI